MKALVAILIPVWLFGQCSSLPLSYCGRTDLVVATGSAPTISSSGTSTTDPDFHSRVMRVTQSGDCGITAGANYYPNQGQGWARSWNADSTKILLQNSTSSGSSHYRVFDPVAFTLGSCVEVSPAKLGKWTNFAWTTTNRIYGMKSGGTDLAYWDTASGSATVVFDLTTIPGFTAPAPYLMEGDSSDAWFCTVSNSQDTGTQAGCYNRSTTDTQVINLAAATSKQNSASAVALDNLSSAQLANCVIHEITLTKGTPWMFLTLNNCTAFPKINGANGVGLMFWQLGTNHVTYLPDYNLYSSHAGIGWNKAWINNPGSQPPCGTFVSAGWKFWFVDSIGTSGAPHYSGLPTCLTTTGFATDGHVSWENNTNDASVNAYPLIAQMTKDAAPNTTTPLEWEILAMQTSPALAALNALTYETAPTATIWRLAHTFNDPVDAQCSEMSYISANVSRDGKFVSFSSDWGGQTGSGSCTNSRRLDVFVVDAASAMAYAGSSISGKVTLGGKVVIQ